MKEEKIKGMINWDLSDNQKITLNIFSSIFNLIITIGINFFLSPYIVKNLGAEANGFTSLANNIISYAALLKVAMNSMGSRFITLSYLKGDKEKANRYYSALFFGDLGLSLILTLISVCVVFRLEYLIDISAELVADVKVLFSLLFFEFIFNTITSVWLTATFITNKIYLDKIREIQGILVKIVVIVVAFSIFEPKIYYVAMGTVAATFITNAYSLYYKRILVPELKADFKYFDYKYVKKILASGIWNSISNLGDLLFSGLDLLMSNVFISSFEMGVLAISKTMPGLISSFNGTLVSVFTPALVSNYAKDGRQAVVENAKKFSKMMIIICTIPLAFLVVYGTEFYHLWQPTQDAERLQILSVLASGATAITAGAAAFYNIFTVVNKVKQLSIVTLITGGASIVLTFFLVRYTDLGIIAIAGVSSVMYCLRSLLWGIPMAGKYLGMKKRTFYPIVVYNIITFVAICLMGFGLKHFIPCSSWVEIIFSGAVFGILALGINIGIVLNRREKKALLSSAQQMAYTILKRNRKRKKGTRK